MFHLSVRADIKRITGKLSELAYRQLPYAEVLAVNDLATDVQVAERADLKKVLDRPAPFTLNAIGIRKARKSDPRAIVYVKDKTAAYLLPYELGGLNKLNSRALLKPVNVKLNQYGNLPRNLLARLKGRANVFIGTVHGKSGPIDGVWQRIKATKGKPAGLKLLIRFSNAHPTKPILGYRKLAERVVKANFNRRFGAAMARAIATASR